MLYIELILFGELVSPWNLATEVLIVKLVYLIFVIPLLNWHGLGHLVMLLRILIGLLFSHSNCLFFF